MVEGGAPAVHSTPEAIELSDLAASQTQETTAKGPGWWHQHVQASVDLHACRDHLANERTYLAHLRTSNAVAQFGILVVMVFRLKQPNSSPSPVSLHHIGVPIATTSLLIAMMMSCFGAHRYFCVQRGVMANPSRTLTGGWEIWTIGLSTALVWFMSVV